MLWRFLALWRCRYKFDFSFFPIIGLMRKFVAFFSSAKCISFWQTKYMKLPIDTLIFVGLAQKMRHPHTQFLDFVRVIQISYYGCHNSSYWPLPGLIDVNHQELNRSNDPYQNQIGINGSSFISCLNSSVKFKQKYISVVFLLVSSIYL